MWPNPQETANLVTFTEEIFNGKLHFMCSDNYIEQWVKGLRNHYGGTYIDFDRIDFDFYY